MTTRPAANRGMTMLEVLVTIVITAFGLLGVAAVQARMHLAEMEAYQRAQATILLRYVTDRINANRRNASAYVTTDAVGVDKGLQDCSALTGAGRDVCEWSNMLAGAGETLNGERVGALIGARGCIAVIDPAAKRYMVSLVWQGLNPTAAPTATQCGSGSYTDDRKRRALVAPITIACLQNDINTGVCITP